MRLLIILGVDPGSYTTGYGIIEVTQSGLIPLDFGCIQPPKNAKIHQRCLVIFESIDELIRKFQPNSVIVETQFVYKNVRTALILGMVKGAVMIAAAKQAIEVAEYSPTQAKIAVSGNGHATKSQVQHMIQYLLGLSQIPEPHDVADALALALCHAHHVKYQSVV